jgi:hypothetical protein
VAYASLRSGELILMTYFPDLSPYVHTSSSRGVPTRNVGWLDASESFPVAEPSKELLERLWQFCLVSVCPTRGIDECPLCDDELAICKRNGMQRVFGTAEIRVFDLTGQAAFAAPNLIYHFVEKHHYSPPPEFLEALEAGPQPASDEYRELLRKSGVRWSVSKGDDVAFRFVKRDDGEVVKEWVLAPKD